MSDTLTRLVPLSGRPRGGREFYLRTALAMEPGLIGDPDISWFRLAEQASLYLEETGSIPSRVGAVRSGDIGRWLNSQREHHNNGKLDQRKRKILDNMVPGWDKVRSSSRVVNSIRRIEQVASFKDSSGRLPSLRSKDSHERDCAEALRHLRSGYASGGISAAEASLADSMIRGWRRGLGKSRP